MSSEEGSIAIEDNSIFARMSAKQLIPDPRPDEHRACIQILKLIEEGESAGSNKCNEIRAKYKELFNYVTPKNPGEEKTSRLLGCLKNYPNGADLKVLKRSSHMAESDIRRVLSYNIKVTGKIVREYSTCINRVILYRINYNV